MNHLQKKKLPRILLITQISIYLFIVIHSVVWYVFGFHYLPKLCPGKFGLHVGNLEFNLNIIFWSLVFLSTLFVGRAFCGWGCMWGAFQDFADRFLTRFNIPRFRGKAGKIVLIAAIVAFGVPFLALAPHRWPSLFWFAASVLILALIAWWISEKNVSGRKPTTIPKYLILMQILGGIISSWIVLNVFDKGVTLALDKYGVLEDYRSLAGALSALTGFTVATIAVAAERRFFCRYLCPYGLALRFLSAIPFAKRMRVKATGNSCTGCSQCNRVCPMGLQPMEEIRKYGMVKSPECINCLRCVAKCPKDTLDFTNK